MTKAECNFKVGCHTCLENWRILKEDCDRFLAADRMDARPLLVNTAKALSDYAQVMLTQEV